MIDISSKKKKGERVIVRCVGMSSSDVTGSCYLVECTNGEQILLDCGLYQSGSVLELYKVNKRKFNFKPKNITAVLISHINADHYCLLPKFVADGGNCNFYISEETLDFTKPMLEDSARIMERDAEMLSKRKGKDCAPVYTSNDVINTLPHFRGCEKNVIHKISDNVCFKFVPAGHIFGSCQIELYITLPNKSVKKICYTGDLGNSMFEHPFIEDYEQMAKCDMLIGETTYNNPKRSAKKCQRKKDEEILKETVLETCIENKGIVLIPTFALQRTETIVYELYKIFGNIPGFKIPVVIDSPLAVKLLKCFNDNLDGYWKSEFDKMMQWENLHIISDYEASLACIEDKSPKVVCSSSGMLTQGRSVQYLKEILPRKNCTILTCGYMVEDSLGWKIKNRSAQKTITIEKKACKNRCSVKSMDSFSCHAQYQQLMNTYVEAASNGCEMIWLVHGDNGKIEFKKALDKRIAKICKTTKVVATNKDTVAHI